MRVRVTGYSITECLVVISISGIVTAMAMPSMNNLVERSRATTSVNWLIGLIYATRTTAITQGTTTTLCPTRDNQTCGGKWHDRVMIFTDHNEDAKLNERDRLISVNHFPIERGTIKWRAFGNRQYLQMTVLGYTNYHNGNFVYCSADEDPRFRRQLVLSMQGRLRKSYDRNNDGVVEDRYNKLPRC